MRRLTVGHKSTYRFGRRCHTIALQYHDRRLSFVPSLLSLSNVNFYGTTHLDFEALPPALKVLTISDADQALKVFKDDPCYFLERLILRGTALGHDMEHSY